MKTQITLVQHNEEALESKRLHCKPRSETLPSKSNTDIPLTPQMSKSSKHSRVRSNSSVATEVEHSW